MDNPFSRLIKGLAYLDSLDREFQATGVDNHTAYYRAGDLWVAIRQRLDHQDCQDLDRQAARHRIVRPDKWRPPDSGRKEEGYRQARQTRAKKQVTLDDDLE